VVRAAALAVTVLGLLIVAPARSAAPATVRLAAPSDCLTNPSCGPGLKRVYKVDVSSVFVPLTVADAGIAALDDGDAEVAVAFSSDPEVSRPDVRTLRDDLGMVSLDPVVPVIRAKLLRDYGTKGARLIRRRLNAASAVLTTRALRQLNQQTGDGRLPEAVGGEFVDANGLGGTGKKRHGPRIVVGFQDFTENETLAYMYAEALRSAGFRVKVRPAGGLRAETLKALRSGKISLYPGYAGSLLQFVSGKRRATKPALLKTLQRELKKRGARTAKLAPGQDRNVFVTKTATAAQLGLKTLSDAAKHWPAAP
jgi:glycine betaine/choline ABC-type transport system substrate-binding protein